MSARRLNVLVYSGNGCTVGAVRHCIYTLRALLSPNYAVIAIDSETTLKEPWTASCALFVVPGGADLAYCRTLNGEGNRRIRNYVDRGGAYFGFCAGAYYASNRCEFEVGNPKLEVVGARELAFFPGICRGLAFAGFEYSSETGTRAVHLTVMKSALHSGTVPERFRSYYNGGGVFVDAEKVPTERVEVLAQYADAPIVDEGKQKAAVVYCRVGKGHAILSSTHIEFAERNLSSQPDVPGYGDILRALKEDDSKRDNFLRACLLKLGLSPPESTSAPPDLSEMHLSSFPLNATADLLDELENIIEDQEGHSYIKDDNDHFLIEAPASFNFKSLQQSVDAIRLADTSEPFEDMNKVLKHIVVHHDALPEIHTTPYFNHRIYYDALERLTSKMSPTIVRFGTTLLYGEVVTSTNTLLEKNVALLRRLPTGTTASATTQIAGRGRGSNVWVSPPGSLIFSTVIRHPSSLASRAPVVFLQYLAALASVRGIKTYDKAFQNLPVKLKWPNDIYAWNSQTKAYAKIGGILVNSHYFDNEFLCVVGIGINTTNAAPTISLNSLVAPQTFQIERLLAHILTAFADIYHRFIRTGFDAHLEDLYYQSWLHNDQIVMLETEGNKRARITGITTDWGLLKAEEVAEDNTVTGRKWQLQSDCNSFDFFHGLLKRKV